MLRDARSAACFFSAAFLGKNAEIHLARAGIAHVVLVDIDAVRLCEMAAIYPTTWETRAGDAYALVRAMAASAESFDVVTVDPFTNQIPRALDAIDAWLAVTARYLVIGADAGWFAARGGVKRSIVDAWLADHGCAGMARTRRIHRRSEYGGGVYWIVLERGAPPKWAARALIDRGLSLASSVVARASGRAR